MRLTMNLKDFITKQTSNRHFDEFVSLLPDSYKGNFIKFLDDYEVALKEEYASNDTPKYCTIKGVDFLIPASYNGDVDSFLDDISYFQNNENHKYEIHNACNKNYQIEQKDIVLNVTAGDNDNYSLHLLTPLKMAKRQASKEDIELELMKKMVARYMTAYTKTCRLNEDRASEQKEIQDKIDSSKEGKTDDKVLGLFNKSEHKLYTLIKSKTSDKKRPISLSQSYFSYCNNEHSKHIAKITAMRLGSALKWSAKQTADVALGLLGSPFFAAYNLLDKKYHIAEKQLPRILGSIRNFTHTALNDYVRPKIKKALLTASITTILSTSALAAIKYSDKIGNFFEKVKTEQNEKKQAKKIETAQNKKYKITDKQSFDELYNAAFPLIIKSMLPTEMLINKGYSDNNKGVPNTIGIGSYWYPKNGDYKSPDWTKTSDFLKKHPNHEITSKQAKDLADGWFRYRENGRVYNNMYKLLQGCELTIYELSAIASCYYNNEAKGACLCNYVHDNYKNPVKCANYIINLECNDPNFKDGIFKRHVHEALLYLNIENYQQKIGMFLLKENKGKFCGSSVTQLSVAQCNELREDMNKGNLNVAKKTAQCIFNYVCKNGTSVDEITGNCFNDVDYTMAEIRKTSSSMYEAALTSYNNGDYEKARDGFQKMISAGYSGADILNDLAITQYHLGEYNECIATCQKILETGEEGQYSPANFNAGMAYEKMGKLSRAYENYKIAAERNPDVLAYQTAANRVATTISYNSNNLR